MKCSCNGAPFLYVNCNLVGYSSAMFVKPSSWRSNGPNLLLLWGALLMANGINCQQGDLLWALARAVVVAYERFLVYL